jgi:hypothetical protein
MMPTYCVHLVYPQGERAWTLVRANSKSEAIEIMMRRKANFPDILRPIEYSVSPDRIPLES